MRGTHHDSNISFQGQDNNLYIIESLNKDAKIENGTTVDCIKSTEQGQPEQTKQKAIYIGKQWYLYEENLKFKDAIDLNDYYIVTKTTERNEDGSIIDGATAECISIEKENTDPSKKEAIYIGKQWYITENLRQNIIPFIQREWNKQSDPNKNPPIPHNRQVITKEILKKLGLPGDYAEFQPYKELYQNIQNGHKERIKTFLEKNQDLDFESFNKKFYSASNGQSFLFSLARGNFFNAINILKERGYNFQNDEGFTRKNGDGTYSTFSALYTAAEKGHTEAIEALIEAGCNPSKGCKIYDKDDFCFKEISPLYAATKDNKDITVNALLTGNALLYYDTIDDYPGNLTYNKQGKIIENTSPLFKAIEQGFAGVANQLILADIKKKSYNRPDYKKITHDSQTDTKTETSLLYEAITCCKNGSMVKLLLQLGGYIVEPNKDSKRKFENETLLDEESVLYAAARTGNTEAIKALKKAGYNFTEDNGCKRKNQDGTYSTFFALYAAAQNGHTETLKALIEAGCDPNQDKGFIKYDQTGELTIEKASFLYIAAKFGHTETIKALIEAGCDPNKDNGFTKYDQTGKLPIEDKSVLYIAAEKGHTGAIEAIIEAGCVPQQDKGGIKYDQAGKLLEKQSVLFAAAQNGHTGAIEALKKAGYNFTKDEGCTRTYKDGTYSKVSALYIAAHYGRTGAIEALKKAGYNFTKDEGLTIYGEYEKPIEKISSLFTATANRFTETIKALMQAGCDAHTDKGYITYGEKISKKTALQIAAESENTETFNLIRNYTLYNLATEGNIEGNIVQINNFITENNIDLSKAITIEVSDNYRQEIGLLYLAITNNNRELIKLLYNKGLNVKNDPGKKTFDKDGKFLEEIKTAEIITKAPELTKNLVKQLRAKKASYTSLGLRRTLFSRKPTDQKSEESLTARLLSDNSTNRNSAAGGPVR